MISGYRIQIRITFLEEILGTAPNNPDIYREFIASKAPDAKSMEEEVASIGVESVIEKAVTIFPKENGKPFCFDYMLKGFFKDTCAALNRTPKRISSQLKAFKKIINGNVFVFPRKIFFIFPEGATINHCERPLRGQTPQGERITLVSSETIPVGSSLEFEVLLLNKSLKSALIEWLDFGELSGLGQWRNSGKGRFTYEILGENDERKKEDIEAVPVIV
jgi:hypothetical protein